MINLRPFRAWRPAPDKAHLVASRSYVAYSDEQLREKLAGNPFTFLHVIHPEHGNTTKRTRFERFASVKRKWDQFLDNGWYQREEQPCFYLYEQSNDRFRSRGVIGAVAVDDYLQGKIKVHEHTLEKREGLFKDYLESTGINAEPVLLAIPGTNELEGLLSEFWNARPDLDFSTTDMVRHKLWAVHEPAVMAKVTERFSRVDALYIADGHHRMASSARLPDPASANADDPKKWCLAFIVPQDQLHIHNFDRAVTSLAGMDTQEFLRAVAAVGKLKAMDQAPSVPPPAGTVYMCTRQGWYALELPPAPVDADSSERLDASILSNTVLGPVLGIHDLRTDPHVKFVPGDKGTKEIARMVADGDAAVAFNLRPVSFAELQSVADPGGCMPPKSTYIEPKLRSGLTVYSLEDM
ncbi:MAG: DUF1015 domain-containing protein [Flavobacteriales bacterium]|nr:DUF1015 domain-containing protein [Flavobacteriales bacterium]MBP6641920.1 DUF1015 domain-containing protein [Flavobacteriales bacterium]MBP7156626.1 DUF1015 domain-containing protein [Flavobacteriales bacterium]HQV75397.1 DUF1015 domain-containing protein [Flavobacteriales bacterium]HQW41066.1 DUF1015 domain-containing protein [Flavobacteriales bacterium]